MGRKRKSGEGTVRLRKDGRWEGRVVIGYDEKGLPKTKNVLAKTKGECVEKLKALRETISPTIPSRVRADMPFEEWLDHWYETYSKPTIRPRTQRTYEGYLRLYIKPKLGSIPLNKLTTNDIQQFCAWMKSDDHISGNGIADSQIRNCYSLCHRALEKARTEHLISRDPTDGFKLPPVRCEEMKILSREAMQKLLIQAKEENYYELFLLELATGLRLGEIAALQWDDLNLETGELRINKQAGTDGPDVVICEPKTKAAVRTLILPPTVLKMMREYRGRVDSRWMFPSPKKEDSPMRPSSIHLRLHRILDHAGCNRVRFHDLRHTFATSALAYGLDIKTLSTILGHASSATTLNTYSHITDEMRQRATEKIDRGIAKVEAKPQEEESKERAMTTFHARKRWSRKAS